MDGIDRRTVLTGMLGVALAGTGCSSQEPEGPSPSPTPTPSPRPSLTPSPSPSPTPSPTPTADLRPRWPLTGALIEDPQTPTRAAVAVKVPDNKNEHPQVGLNEADIVFVQLDGYPDRKGYDGTRLMPVFHSRMAEAAAPVRSIRPVDAPLLAPMTAVIGSSGGAPWVMDYLAGFTDYISSDLVYIDMKKTGAYSVNRDRIYKYKGKTEYDRALVCHPAVLGEKAGVFAQGPQAPYLPFATGDDLPSTTAGAPASQVDVPWKGKDFVMGYTYDEASGTYLRSMPWGEHRLADGSRVTTDNVLVIRAEQSREKLIRGDGGAEPIHHIIDSSGTFVYSNGGRHVTGTWSKGAVPGPFSFVLEDGSPLLMAPGRTFVELAAIDAPVQIS